MTIVGLYFNKLHEVMFSKKSDGWQNGNLINLKYKKLKTRKEKVKFKARVARA